MPAVAANNIINILYKILPQLKLYSYQELFFVDYHTFTITNKSRRIGYSFYTAYEGIVRAHIYKKYTRQFVSYNMDDAKEKIREAREIYEAIPLGMQKKIISDSKTTLEFLDYDGKTSSRLISRPCTPPRGKGGDVVLDEFAFYQDPEKIYAAALPVLVGGEEITKYKLQIGSTPFGVSNLFANIWKNIDNYKNYHRYEVFWWECPRLCRSILTAKKIAPSMLTRDRLMEYGTDLLREIYENLPEEDFRQEYELEFQEERDSYIPWEWITRAANIDEWYKTIDDLFKSEEKELFLGCDIGRKRNCTEIILIKKYTDGQYGVVGMFTYSQKEFSLQERDLSRLLGSKRVIRACLDSTGIGMQLTENLKKKFSVLVEPIHFTSEVKTQLSNGIYIAFERQVMNLLRDKDLMQQIHSIKKTMTESLKYPRFDTESTAQHHADKYWALALALHAAESRSHYGKIKQIYADLKQKAFETNIQQKSDVLDLTGKAGSNEKMVKTSTNVTYSERKL